MLTPRDTDPAIRDIRFTDLLHLRFTGAMRGPEEHPTKLERKKVIQAAGGRVAETYAILESPAHLKLADLPASVVIKPNRGHTSRWLETAGRLGVAVPDEIPKETPARKKLANLTGAAI